jgi:hypothetical protein
MNYNSKIENRLQKSHIQDGLDGFVFTNDEQSHIKDGLFYTQINFKKTGSFPEISLRLWFYGENIMDYEFSTEMYF